MTSARDVDVTILLSTRNNAARLRQTLEGLTRLRIPGRITWEVVAVDNGSSDETPRVLAEAATGLPIRTVTEPVPGLSRARNAGIRTAQGALLIFTDDDVTVPTGWLEAYADAWHAMGDRCYFGGPIVSDYEGPTPDPAWLPYAPASVRGLDWGPDARALTEEEYFIGPNWACAVGPVRAAGGFDPCMGLGATDGPGGGEETDLMARLGSAGLTGWYLPGAVLAHRVPAAKAGVAHIAERWEVLGSVTAWRDPERFRNGSRSRIPALLRWRRLAARVRWGLSWIGLGNRVVAAANLRWLNGLVRGLTFPPRTPWRTDGDPLTH
jgi:glucosyl-dolichyl phosphate glucuronosyltransferase